MNINIIVRGDTCRGCSLNIQEAAYASIIRHVIKPLKKPNVNVNVFIVNYVEDEKIKLMMKRVFTDYILHICYANKQYVKNQVDNFMYALNSLPKYTSANCECVIILRSDLVFKQDVDFTRANSENICFQWNLMTCIQNNDFRHHLKWDFSKSKIGDFEKDSTFFGTPDQIQYIGGKQWNKFLSLMNTEYIGFHKVWKNSLHDLFQFCSIHFNENSLQYLNYIIDPTPEVKCSDNSMRVYNRSNPLYEYTRILKNPSKKAGTMNSH